MVLLILGFPHEMLPLLKGVALSFMGFRMNCNYLGATLVYFGVGLLQSWCLMQFWHCSGP